MAKYVVKRVLLAVVTMFLICFITFFTMNAIPGGPFNGEKAKSEAVMQALNARYGLDKPVEVQFANYMKNLFHGDFGISLKTGRSISQTIFESFRVSAKLGLMAVLVALICGIVLGCVAALNRNKWPDHIIISLLRCLPQCRALLRHRFCSLCSASSLDGFRSGAPAIRTMYFRSLHFPCLRWRISRVLRKPACWMCSGRTMCVLQGQRVCIRGR